MVKFEKYFCGTIIIGDPCSMVKDGEDWYLCEFGEELGALGIDDFLTFKFEEDSPKVIDDRQTVLGSFCTDSCMVTVLCLDELIRYNTDFDGHIKRPRNFTVIENFEGFLTVEKNGRSARLSGNGSLNFTVVGDDD